MDRHLLDLSWSGVTRGYLPVKLDKSTKKKGTTLKVKNVEEALLGYSRAGVYRAEVSWAVQHTT